VCVHVREGEGIIVMGDNFKEKTKLELSIALILAGSQTKQEISMWVALKSSIPNSQPMILTGGGGGRTGFFF